MSLLLMPSDRVVAAVRQRRPSWRWSGWVAPLFGVVAAVAVMAAMRGAVCDDAWITLSYARELAEHGRWGMLPGLSANTATSPLNVALLAGAYVLDGHRPVVAVGMVLAVSLAVLGAAVASLVRGPSWRRAVASLVRGPSWRRAVAGMVAVALLASSPLMVSTVGLESYLAAAVLAAHAWAAAPRRWALAGMLLGLAVLTRPDLAVPAVVLDVGLLAFGNGRGDPTAAGGVLGRFRAQVGPPVRHALTVAAIGAAVALPWHLWSWWHLGGFVPDTLWLKVGESAWEGYRFADGVGLYWRDFPAATGLTVVVMAAGMLAAVVARRRVPLVLVLAGVAHFAALCLLNPSPYSWYFAPPFVLCALALAVAVPDLPGCWWTQGPALATVAATTLVGALLVADRPDPEVGPVVYNWASSAQYQAAGPQIARLVGSEPVDADVEIGALAWSCRCALHNMFTDRAVTDHVVADRLATAGPWMRRAMALNFAHRSPAAPPAYRWRIGGAGVDVLPIPGRRWVWPSYTPAHGRNGFMLERLGP